MAGHPFSTFFGQQPVHETSFRFASYQNDGQKSATLDVAFMNSVGGGREGSVGLTVFNDAGRIFDPAKFQPGPLVVSHILEPFVGHARDSRYRPLSEENVEQLVYQFEDEGCHRYDPENFVPCCMTRDRWSKAVEKASLDSVSLKSPKLSDPPLLPLPERSWLVPLRGRHRIEAARRFFDDDDAWWILNVYCLDQSSRESTFLREAWVNTQPYSDGEIMRRIRMYQNSKEVATEKKWWARLSRSKQRNLKQLQKSPKLWRLVDQLLGFPGLWEPVQLGAFHRLLPLGCTDVRPSAPRILSELTTAGGDMLSGPHSSDLEGDDGGYRPPGSGGRQNLSRADCAKIEHMMENMEIFPSEVDEARRRQLLTNIQGVSSMIPSMRSLMENTIYLEPCALAMELLTGPLDAETIKSCLYDSFSCPSEPIIERSRGTRLAWDDAGDRAKYRPLAYQQLWLFAMRNLPELISWQCPRALPKKDPKKPKPLVKELDFRALYEFACFASSLGFHTTKIKEIIERDPDWALAERFVGQSRPSNIYDVGKREEVITSIVEALKRFEKKECSPPAKPQWHAIEETPVPKRFCRPFEQESRLDVNYLYLPFLQLVGSVPAGHSLSSLFVRLDSMNAFLGCTDGQEPEEQREKRASSAVEAVTKHAESCTTRDGHSPRHAARASGDPGEADDRTQSDTLTQHSSTADLEVDQKPLSMCTTVSCTESVQLGVMPAGKEACSEHPWKAALADVLFQAKAENCGIRLSVWRGFDNGRELLGYLPESAKLLERAEQSIKRLADVTVMTGAGQVATSARLVDIHHQFNNVYLVQGPYAFFHAWAQRECIFQPAAPVPTLKRASTAHISTPKRQRVSV
ncbi:MAG: hypothetical protein M1814_000918 [Vezdaea aestivalis]|nr:MAG: hypothetical protein M1814_000918 [Vezdaea aestivalis]